MQSIIRTGWVVALTLMVPAANAAATMDDFGDETRFFSLTGKDARGGIWYDLEPGRSRDWFTRHSEPGRAIRRSAFSMSRDQGPISLQWGGAQGEYQQLQQAGVSLGGFGISAFSGDGETISDIRHSWQGASNFHFHGGLQGDYTFDGMRLGYTLSGGPDLAFTRASIRAGGLETRAVSELSLGLGNHSLTLLQVDSDGSRAGQAIGIGSRIGSFSLSMRHMVAENDASWSALALTTRQNGKTLGLHLEQRRNPLYQDGNDNRVMLSMGFALRGSSLLRAAESSGAEASGEDEEAEEKSMTTPILVGAGVVGAGLVLSSGGGNDNDGKARFNTQNGAAKQVLNEVNPRSIAQNREWGGFVYRLADGTYSSTKPVQGGPVSISLPAPQNAVPRGTTATASYHTHAAFDPRYDNENFSPQDILSDNIFNIDGYLGTPAGQFKFHDVSRNEVVTLGGPGTLATQ